VTAKLLGMGIPIKFKSLQAILKDLPRVSPESVKGTGLKVAGEMIDLRRLVAKLPMSMHSVIDSWLAMKASMDRRGKRRRSSAAQPGGGYGNNNPDPYANPGFSNYDDGAKTNRRGSYAKTGMMASLKLDASLPAQSQALYGDTARVGTAFPDHSFNEIFRVCETGSSTRLEWTTLK
jgi:hypothetical protein